MGEGTKMLDQQKPTQHSSFSSLVEFARADVSKTVSLFFAPVTAVATELTKAIRGNLNANSVNTDQHKP
jgi:hypothetical protein